MFKRKCKITFIRHGSTIYSDENRFSDNPNYPPLNELGKIESQNIAQWVQKRSPKVDKIYSSSDLKSIQTCKYVSKEYQKEFEIVDGLQARKAGKWNTLNFEQIEKQYPKELDLYHNDRLNYWVEGGENNIAFCKRIRENISKIIAENTGNRIIIVTNGDVVQAEICSALNIPLENLGKIYIPCGSATQLSYFSDWTSLVYAGYLPL